MSIPEKHLRFIDAVLKWVGIVFWAGSFLLLIGYWAARALGLIGK